MTIAPPDQSVWWDVDEIVDAALVMLGVAADDPLADRLAELVPAAGQRINDYLDRPADAPVPAGPDAPAPLVDALVQVVVELYRRKDAPPSSVDAMLAGAWRPQSIDPLTGVRAMIAPYRRRWGIG